MNASQFRRRTALGALLTANLWAHLGMASEVVRSISVRYGDLNLSRSADVAILYRRIRHAAELTCAPRIPPGSRVPRSDYQPCVDEAVNVAVRSVDSPALSAYHHTRRSDSHA